MKYVLHLLPRMPRLPSVVCSEGEHYDVLPFDDPPPLQIEILGRNFCLSGVFDCNRSAVEAAIVDQGGRISRQVTYQTDYVIVGAKASKGWKFGNYGNKINDAIQMRSRYKRPILLAETQWVSCNDVTCHSHDPI